MASSLITAGASLGACFLEAAAAHPDRVALDVAGASRTYRELAELAGRIASVLSTTDRPRPRLGAVFAARSEVAYAGVLGTLISGAGYVPLNPKFPPARNGHMLAVSGSRTLVLGAECVALAGDVLAHAAEPLLIVAPTASNAELAALAARHPSHRWLGADDVRAAAPITTAPAVDPAEIAYLLFTSGSTGAPKGVMVAHANVLPHLDAMWRRYAIAPDDRFSQTFDLTFDLSVFDMFTCWGRGASLHCVPAEQLAAPDDFVRAHALTVWFSVPSLGMMLRNLRRLSPDAFPTLRWSLFCGERLPADVASAWQIAAPRSTVENLYGPTEATIACTLYRWHAGSPAECVDGTVPIGEPYPGMTAAIVDDDLREVARGERGELCVKGPQVTHGYWRDPDKTRERFVAMPWYAGPDNRWYRTGDLAYVDAGGRLIHCGRNDDQVKLRGFRIELPEVEHAIRTAADTSFAVVLPYPSNRYGLQGLTAVVARSPRTEDEILDGAKATLPEYMVPGRVVFVDDLPLNANGKIDKQALLARLRAEDDA